MSEDVKKIDVGEIDFPVQSGELVVTISDEPIEPPPEKERAKKRTRFYAFLATLGFVFKMEVEREHDNRS